MAEQSSSALCFEQLNDMKTRMLALKEHL